MRYLVSIEVPDGKLQAILTEMHEAQKTIEQCLYELKRIEFLSLKEDAASGN